MNALALLFALACSQGPVVAEPETLTVRTWLDGELSGHGGTLVVQTLYDPEGTVDLPRPEVEGLTFEEATEPLLERIGDHDVLTQRYTFSGKKGAYEIGDVVAVWHGPDGEVQANSSPVFVDIGVEAPRETEPADILEPAAVWTPPWAVIGAILLGFGVLGSGLFVAFGLTRRRDIPEAPPEPADVLAIRAWEAIRGDATMDEHEKAQHLSRIFREYAESVLGFSATAWTTTEIVEHLRGLAHMPEGNVPRAKRLLRATDRVKFADHHPDRDFFDDLDSDLRAFVGSTRPRTWDKGGGA